MKYTVKYMAAPAPSNTTIQLNANELNLGNAPKQIQENQVATLLGTVYFIAGIVAVIVIIVGGIRYVTSGGDSSGIASAKNTIMYAVVGLVVVIMASAITTFVINNVGK